MRSIIGDTLMRMTDNIIARYDLVNFVNNLWRWPKDHPIELHLLEEILENTWFARAYSGLPIIEINNAALSNAGLLDNLRFVKVMLVHEVGHLDYYGRIPAPNRVIDKEQDEYIADKFVIEKGYGNDLLWGLRISIQKYPNNLLNKLRLANAAKLIGESTPIASPHIPKSAPASSSGQEVC